MQQLKTWKTTGEGKYALFIDYTKIGEIAINQGTRTKPATITIGNEKYSIARTGFWKSSVEIMGQNQKLLGKIYPEKWHSNSYTVNFYDKTYMLSFRNNPLSEFVIAHEGKEMLAYSIGADTSGKLAVKITSYSSSVDYFFDFLLWYWFVPVAIENIGNAKGIYPVQLSNYNYNKVSR